MLMTINGNSAKCQGKGTGLDWPLSSESGVSSGSVPQRQWFCKRIEGGGKKEKKKTLRDGELIIQVRQAIGDQTWRASG